MGTGKTYSTKYLLDSNNNTGAAGQVLSTTSTGINWVDSGTLSTGLWLSDGNDIYNSNSGNVGIGTTSPGATLELNSDTGNAAKLKIGRQNGATNYLELGTSGGSSVINAIGISGVNASLIFNRSTTTATTQSMIIDSAGNVGIGTASPSQKLHVAGNARVTGAYYDSNNSPGTANQVLISTVTGTDWVDGSGSSIIGGPYLPLAGGTMTGTAGVLMPDNFKLKFGDATTPDLQIYHDGSNSYISDGGTGNLRIRSTSLRLENTNSSNMIVANGAGSVSLYYNAVKKLGTTSTGVTVTGDGTFTGSLDVNGTGNNTFTGNILIDNVAPIIQTNSSNNASGLRINVTGIADSTNNLLRVQRSGTTMIDTRGNGNTTFTAKAFSAATSSGDASSTLTTKGYVDSLITGATIYRGTWDPDVSLNSGYGNPDLSGVTQTSGYYYICSADGAATPNGTGNEPDSWNTGDWVIWNDDIGASGEWQKIDNSSVLSGAGTGQTVALWQGASSVTDSETLGNSLITQSGDVITIGSSSVSQLALNSIANNDSVIYFKQVGTNKAKIGYDHSEDALAFIHGSGAFSTAGMVLDGTGVGIGTTSPQTNLEVTSATGAKLRLGTSDTSVLDGDTIGRLEFFSADSTNTNSGLGAFIDLVADGDQGNFNPNADLRFATSYGSAQPATTRMTIKGNGNVGIGATSPSEKLEVTGNQLNSLSTNSDLIHQVKNVNTGTSARARLLLSNDAANAYYMITGTNYTPVSAWANTAILGCDSAIDGGVAIYSADKVAIQNVAGVDTVTVKGSQVGIGTTSPSQKLEVDGAVKVTNTFTGETSANSGYFDFASTTSTARITTKGSDGSTLGKFQILQQASDGSPNNTPFYIDSDSNVGIGTTGPSAKLDVNGVIRSRGGSYAADVDTKTDVGLVIPENYFIYTADGPSYLRKLIGKTSDIITIGEAGTSLIAGINLVPGTVGGYVQIFNNSSIAAKFVDGKLGIGTTSPSAKLHVYSGGLGTTNNNTTTQAIFSAVNANASNLYIQDYRTADGSDWTTSGKRIQEKVDSTWMGYVQFNGDSNNGGVSFGTGTNSTQGNVAERMRITSSGNVGIGTTNPTRLLSISNSDTATTPQLLITQNGAGDAVIGFNRPGHQGWAMGIDSSIGNNFEIHNSSGGVDSSSQLAITPAGNVGIGTTSPDAPLTVTNNAVSSYIINVNMADDVDGGGFYEAAGGMELYLKDTSGTGQVKLTSSGSSYLNGGNVGIGTTSPSYPFSLESGTTGLTSRIYNTNTDGQGLLIRAGATTSNTRALQVASSNDTKIMTVTSNGRVGIGTTSPTEKLHIAASNNPKIKFSATSPAGGYATYGTIDTGNGFLTWADVTTGIIGSRWQYTGPPLSGRGDTYINLHDTNGIDVIVNDSQVVKIEDGGNVGIGTTSPVGRLEVVTTDANRYIRFKAPNGEERFQFYTGGTGNASILGMYTLDGTTKTVQIAAGGTSYFNAGNVGIGTTSPSSLLHLESASSPTLQIKDTTNDVTFKAYAQDSNTHLANVSNHDLFIDTNNTARITVKSGGNVGIGTTSPGSKLEISSTSDALLELNGGTTANPYMLFAQNGTRRAYIQYVNGGLLSLASEYGDIRFMTGTGGAETEKMRITSTGNVGIGTTSPNLKLDVISGTNNGIRISATDTTSNWRDIDIRSYVSQAQANALPDGSAIYTTNPTSQTETAFSKFGGLVLQGRDDGNSSFAIRLGNGNGYATRMFMGATGATVFSNTVTATNFILSSDERLKENVEKVCDNRVKADWKTFELKTDKGQKRYGVIAQELEKTNPEFVREDSKGFKSVAYIDLLIAKIAELEARLEKLEK